MSEESAGRLSSDHHPPNILGEVKEFAVRL